MRLAVGSPVFLPPRRGCAGWLAGSLCSACDWEFGALAQARGVPLVTADLRLAAEFPEVAMAPAAFAL